MNMKTRYIVSEIKKFNRLVDKLIGYFSINNLDEDAIVILAKITRHFMTFTHVLVLNILFKVLDKFSNAKYNFDTYILDTNKMTDEIYKKMEDSLNNLLSNKSDKNKENDKTEIIKDLNFLKTLINHLASMILSILKFEAKNIDDDDLKEDYQQFKVNMEKDKDEFESTISSKIKF